MKQWVDGDKGGETGGVSPRAGRMFPSKFNQLILVKELHGQGTVVSQHQTQRLEPLYPQYDIGP